MQQLCPLYPQKRTFDRVRLPLPQEVLSHAHGKKEHDNNQADQNATRVRAHGSNNDPPIGTQTVHALIIESRAVLAGGIHHIESNQYQSCENDRKTHNDKENVGSEPVVPINRWEY
jgi:hypothetical protein